MTFIWVGAAIVALVLTVWGLAEKIKKAYQPKHELEAWQAATDEKLKRDKDRIDEVERGQIAVSKAIIAMLDHEITGNSAEKLKEAKSELMAYLLDRKGG